MLVRCCTAFLLGYFHDSMEETYVMAADASRILEEADNRLVTVAL